jgi:hypothetical protein
LGISQITQSRFYSFIESRLHIRKIFADEAWHRSIRIKPNNKNSAQGEVSRNRPNEPDKIVDCITVNELRTWYEALEKESAKNERIRTS